LAPAERRHERVARVLWVTLALNLLVAASKLAYGITTGTLAVSADGYHSALDGCSNICALIGITLARRPPDADHHYGHQKYEILSAMGVSFLLFLAAGQIVLESIDRIGEGVDPRHSPWGYPLLLVTLAINALVYRWERREGERLGSPILLADAQHTRTDMLATIGALASVAAVGLGWVCVDLAVALGFGVVIVRAAYAIIGDSIQVLTDRAPIDASEIEAVAASFPDAHVVHRIRSRGTPNQVFIDLSLRVAADLPVREAHELSHEVEDAIRRRFPGVRDVVIHIEPGEGS